MEIESCKNYVQIDSNQVFENRLKIEKYFKGNEKFSKNNKRK